VKLIVIVTEYPKATETFIYRDLLKFAELGATIELHHLAPFRTRQPLHQFAEPTRAWARYTPFIGRTAAAALLRALFTRPRALFSAIARIVWAYRAEPKLLLKSLMLVPKAAAMADHARRAGTDHLHAEFAGHPATVAWLIHRLGGPAYSVSCRAHDIFRTQSLLDVKLTEASAVRTVSNFGRTFLQERIPALRTRPIHVIHSSVDLARIAPAPEADGPSRFRILYVGALEAKKGVAHLLDALSLASERLGDWECELAGNGPLRGALERQAEALGIGERVRFHGALDFDAVTAAYGRASVCVAPSVIGPGGRQEGIPNVMIEALAFAKPAISTPISGIPELIEDGVSGLLVPPGEAEPLAGALLRIRADPEFARSLGRRGRAVVEERFDLAANAARQMALFAGGDAQSQQAPDPIGTEAPAKGSLLIGAPGRDSAGIAAIGGAAA
jgi:glycosyltransferase involved in cell wall biosynthesis